MSLPLVITDVGRAALINALHTGLTGVTITQVGVSASTAAVTHATTALAGEIKRLATFGGEAVAADTLHVTISDESTDAYSLNAFGLYLSDGTLFGVYSQADVILEKSAASILLLALDVAMTDISAAMITFGETDFLNPPASHTVVGVSRLATSAEALAGADDTISVTPAGLQAAIQAALHALLPTGATIDWWGTAASVPAGWHICDGTNGTPNLLGRVRIGATGNAAQGTAFDFGSTGGSATMTATIGGTALTVAQLPGHVHAVTDAGHTHALTDFGHTHVLTDGGHAHGVSQNPHNHGVEQTPHNHGIGNLVGQPGTGNNLGGSGGQYSTIIGLATGFANANISLDAASADIAIQGSGSNIGIQAAGTGIGVQGAGTGIAIQSTGGGATHTHTCTTTTNLPPYLAMWPIMKL